jgi:hypothetical protein
VGSFDRYRRLIISVDVLIGVNASKKLGALRLDCALALRRFINAKAIIVYGDHLSRLVTLFFV